MTDIHCHMLPGIDDGPELIEEALELAGIAWEDGIRNIVLTSHYNHPMKFSAELLYEESFLNFEKAIGEKYPGLKLYKGGEVYLSIEDLERISIMNFPVINDTDYVLVEFPRYIKYNEMDSMLHELILAGYRPIVAHMEQYSCLYESIDLLKEFRDLGIILQCNCESVLEMKKKEAGKFVKRSLKENLIDVFASDGHDLNFRPPLLSKAYHEILSHFGQEIATRMFSTNPERILKGEDVERVKHEDVKPKKNLLLSKIGKVLVVLVFIISIILSSLYFLDNDKVDSIENDEIEAVDSVDEDYFEGVEAEDTSLDSSELNEIVINKEDEDGIEGNIEEGYIEYTDEVEEAVGNTTIIQEESIENVEELNGESIVENYTDYLESLKKNYIDVCDGYYGLLKDAVDLEDKTEGEERVKTLLDELAMEEELSDNNVYKTLYDMQNDLEDQKLDISIVEDIREEYLDTKMEVSEKYKSMLEEYANNH